MKTAPKPVTCVVFSKDRPLQLDAALSSMRQCAQGFESVAIKVLFRACGPQYASAYAKVALQHPDVALVADSDFKADMLSVAASSPYVIFVVDDTIFVNPFDIAVIVNTLEENADALGFSLRLGRNTVFCYTQDRGQSLPQFSGLTAGVLRFDWTDAEYDFGYPIELSSSVYRAEDVLPLLRRSRYQNPNTLEAELAAAAPQFAAEQGWLACFESSVALSVPANSVQTEWTNRVGTDEELGVDSLLRRYELGYRLAIETYRGHVPNACHEELDFEYRKDASVPAVSVIVPCYNQARYLEDAVLSVVSQTFTDWELVLVNDGSSDTTDEVMRSIVARHPEKRIRVLGGTNTGLAAARNRGVLASLGRYVLPLDADDEIAPSMLEATVRLLDGDPTAAIAYTDVQRTGVEDDLLVADEFDTVVMPAQNQLSYCSLYRAEVWHAVGGYNPNMEWGYEDWDFWIGAIAAGYRAQRVPGHLFRYRIRHGSMYTAAVQHDAELRRRMRQNHPSLYRWDRRLRTWAWMRYRRGAFWLRARLGGFRRRASRPPVPPD